MEEQVSVSLLQSLSLVGENSSAKNIFFFSGYSEESILTFYGEPTVLQIPCH